jgi:hypothetical protein
MALTSRSTYVKTKQVNQMKAYHKQQEEMAHIKKSSSFSFIDVTLLIS